MKVFVVVREVMERTLIVDVPGASEADAFERAEEATRKHIVGSVDFYRLVPGQHIDDQSPWKFSELSYPDGLDVEAYDYADDDADQIDVTA